VLFLLQKDKINEFFLVDEIAKKTNYKNNKLICAFFPFFSLSVSRHFCSIYFNLFCLFVSKSSTSTNFFFSHNDPHSAVFQLSVFVFSVPLNLFGACRFNVVDS